MTFWRCQLPFLIALVWGCSHTAASDAAVEAGTASDDAAKDNTGNCDGTFGLSAYRFDRDTMCFGEIQKIPACVEGPVSRGSTPLCAFAPNGDLLITGISQPQVSAVGWRFRFAYDRGGTAFGGEPLSAAEDEICSAHDNATALEGCPACAVDGGFDRPCSK
jgi:hypothetical protein